MPEIDRTSSHIAMAKECLHDLAAMFEAIEECGNNPIATKRLAGIGRYLAEDWRDMMEELLEDSRPVADPIASRKTRDGSSVVLVVT
jgi:hypothetical protein